MKLTVKDIAYNGIVASLYVVLTLLTYNFSFGFIQFRIAEVLVLLCFFRKDFVIGLSVGCLIANLFSSISPIDTLIGTLATVISCLCVCYCKLLLFSLFIPAVINGVFIGLEIYLFTQTSHSLFFYISTVAFGEIVVLLFGYLFVLLIRKQNGFYKLIRANQNIDFKL